MEMQQEIQPCPSPGAPSAPWDYPSAPHQDISDGPQQQQGSAGVVSLGQVIPRTQSYLITIILSMKIKPFHDHFLGIPFSNQPLILCKHHVTADVSTWSLFLSE